MERPVNQKRPLLESRAALGRQGWTRGRARAPVPPASVPQSVSRKQFPLPEAVDLSATVGHLGGPADVLSHPASPKQSAGIMKRAAAARSEYISDDFRVLLLGATLRRC